MDFLQSFEGLTPDMIQAVMGVGAGVVLAALVLMALQLIGAAMRESRVRRGERAARRERLARAIGAVEAAVAAATLGLVERNRALENVSMVLNSSLRDPAWGPAALAAFEDARGCVRHALMQGATFTEVEAYVEQLSDDRHKLVSCYRAMGGRPPKDGHWPGQRVLA